MSISNIALIGTYPNEGKGELLNSLVREWKENNKQVILALDEESLQLGLTNYITRLIEGGYVNHLILTGNALIQDFLNAGGEREKIEQYISESLATITGQKPKPGWKNLKNCKKKFL